MDARVKPGHDDKDGGATVAPDSLQFDHGA
jgi:hypothetical protein